VTASGSELSGSQRYNSSSSISRKNRLRSSSSPHCHCRMIASSKGRKRTGIRSYAMCCTHCSRQPSGVRLPRR
jgi:hypothetical protein